MFIGETSPTSKVYHGISHLKQQLHIQGVAINANQQWWLMLECAKKVGVHSWCSSAHGNSTHGSYEQAASTIQFDHPFKCLVKSEIPVHMSCTDKFYKPIIAAFTSVNIVVNRCSPSLCSIKHSEPVPTIAINTINYGVDLEV